jgi:hypothetical protein
MANIVAVTGQIAQLNSPLALLYERDPPCAQGPTGSQPIFHKQKNSPAL